MNNTEYHEIDTVNCIVAENDKLVVEYADCDDTVWFTVNGDQCVNVTRERAQELAANILTFFNKGE